MKTKFVISTCAVLALTCPLFANATDHLSMEKAESIALKHAKLTEEKVHFVEKKLDQDFDKVAYELEFIYNNIKYDYEIDAKTGKVESYSHKHSHSTFYEPNVKRMSEPELDKIALKHFNVDPQSVGYIKSEWDNGKSEYEVEFIVNKTEYEVKLDAVTGKIVEYSEEKK